MVSDRPLVSVITCSWQRPGLLRDTLAHVREQDYPNLEHVVVVEGPDFESLMYAYLASKDSPHPVRATSLGRNWTTYLANSRNAAPMIVGQLLAAGEYITWMADDERATPQHISKLVDLLDSTGCDFAYSMTEMWRKDNPEHRWVIGADPPRFGEVTNVLFRASLLEKGLTRLGAGNAPDWLQIRDWMEAGATWAFLPEVTFSHRADL